MKELAADQGSASIERLVWLRDNAESEQVQFAASRELLDRAYGRARQEIDLTGGNEIRVIIRDFRKEGPSADPQVIDVSQPRASRDAEGLERVITNLPLPSHLA